MNIEKPPLLTDKQIDEAIWAVDKRESLKHWLSGSPELRAIAQAQLDADWEYIKTIKALVQFRYRIIEKEEIK